MPRDDRKYDKFNLTHIIIKPLYFGLAANIIFPGLLLFVCYYLDINSLYTDPVISFELGNTLFILLAALTLANAGLALWMKHQMANSPMIRSKESFEDDLAVSLLEKSKPIFLVIALIAVYGIIYYFLAIRFREAAFFAVFSFLVFQFVRPRVGYVKSLIDKQEKLVEQGIFRKD